MRPILLVAGRELKAYLRSPFGYIVIAAMLLIDGLLFYGFALSGGARLSAEVLRDFFFYSSGTTAIAAVLLSMRLFAEERQTGHSFSSTSPLSETETVLGKFLAAFGFVTLMTLLTAYMPLLIFVHGKVSLGHILVGYTGLLLIGSATLSVGLFASALAPTQVLGAVIGAAILGALYLLWLVARVTDPHSSFLAAAALHNDQFRPFMTGVVDAGNVTYYVGITAVFLLAATKTLEARRWR